jgi:hypothetical protein
MAKGNVPKDVMAELEESGFSFGDDGEIVESSFLTAQVEKKAKKVEKEVEVEAEVEEDDKEEDDDDTLSGDDAEDADDDADSDTEADDALTPPAKPKPLSLTSRKEKEKADESTASAQIARLEAQQAELLERVRKLTEAKPDKEDPTESSNQSLQEEANKFKTMRLRMFAKEVETDVNTLSLGANFKDIIASEEWQSYLNSSVLGTPVGTLYIDAVKENDGKTVVEFFKDFTNRYVPSVMSEKKVSKVVKATVKADVKKPALDDLAVPDRSKSNATPRIKKYDFEEDDYGQMLEKAERGKITFKAFNEFDVKFNDALKQGRVKPSNT